MNKYKVCLNSLLSLIINRQGITNTLCFLFAFSEKKVGLCRVKRAVHYIIYDAEPETCNYLYNFNRFMVFSLKF